MKDDPGVYPPPEVRAKLSPDLTDTEETTRLMTRMWTKLHDRSSKPEVMRRSRSSWPHASRSVKAPWKDPSAEPYIRIDDVSKKFGEFVAVNDVR